MFHHIRSLAIGILTVAHIAAWSQARLANEPVAPLPHAAPVDPQKVALGKQLFHEPRLSGNGRIACASCHDLRRGGTDNQARSTGVGGLTQVNTPTVFNAALNYRQFWDGRASSLEAQVDAVITNPVEMGTTWPAVLTMLRTDVTYLTAFRRAYPDGVTAANVMNAIAAYERTLITPDSRFDRFLRGDTAALDADEQYGYARFKELGCVACHQGVNLGGNMFQRFGIWLPGKRVDPQSLPPTGRYKITGRDADREVFRVPSLRNVALTAPYFHNGSAPTLEDAIQVMFEFQLGRPAPESDKAAIARFLRSLTGQLPQ